MSFWLLNSVSAGSFSKPLPEVLLKDLNLLPNSPKPRLELPILELPEMSSKIAQRLVHTNMCHYKKD